MRKNELKDSAAKRKNNSGDQEAVDARGNAAATEQQQRHLQGIDGNDNQPKEDKQLVYAELVLKPADQREPPPPPSPSPPPKSPTEYAEIVYVKKPPTSASGKK